jgi:hypothetical protein
MSDIMQTLKLPEHVRRRIAVAAEVDPRTVAKYCNGQTVKGMAGERIERALRAENLRLVPDAQPVKP